MSPTVLRSRGYRFYFFSREEPRPHVHVQHAGGEAKFWPELDIDLAVDSVIRPERYPLLSRMRLDKRLPPSRARRKDT